MRKIDFAIGIHFHQPVGNFQEIFERAYQNCYLPFLETFEKFNDIKINIHFSGALLDYFDLHHPEYIEKIRNLVSAGRVEIIGGGYYEPIFQILSQEDRVGQIKMLSSYCADKFGTRPRGLWIPERVWTSSLIPDFNSCGKEYSMLDEGHLINAGISQEDLYGYSRACYRDKKLAIFPIDKTLRYIIPFKSPRETIRYFKKISPTKDKALFTYADDGEKFGEWPWTYDWVYKKKWLNKFFKEIEKNKRWVNTVRFSDYLDANPPIKDVEIPAHSYEEMMKWSGGAWENFLSRYPESNQMHKRMKYVSQRLSRLAHSGERQVDKEKLAEAQRELYKGQTNCPYWHGVFGGIYLHNLRSSIYEHLIKADTILDGIEHKGQTGWEKYRELDFYSGDTKAVILENEAFFISIDLAKGGAITELDYKIKSTNLINTFARHKEVYHEKIRERINNQVRQPLEMHEVIKGMDERVKKGIFYDKYRRSCFLIHFMDKDLGLKDFMNCNYIDRGDFSESEYSSKIDNGKVTLLRNGSVKDKPGIVVTKSIEIVSEEAIELSFTIKNESEAILDSSLGIEFNISMPCAGSDRYSYETEGRKVGSLNKKGSVSKSRDFSIIDLERELSLEFKFAGEASKIWYFPVETISQSERSYDINYQGSCIMPIWDARLSKGEKFQRVIRVRIV